MENYELLRDLYKIHSPSRNEKKMRKFIKDYIKRNIPEVKLTYDNTGNIYATKGEGDFYPCVVSHIDQVQREHGKDFRSYVVDGKVFGFSPSAMKMRGLGADDKNGIWVCLQVLAKYDLMKCAFFVGEEIGCVGSSDADMHFFEDCRYVLQCDRRNGGDLITSICGELCSKEFLDDCGYADFGYKPCHGLTTDVGTLKENGLKVSCVNMSCGYYAPHTDEEYTKLDELQNCLNFVEHIIETCTKVYPHEFTFTWNDDDDWNFGYKYGGGYKKYGASNVVEDYGGYAYRYDSKQGKYVYCKREDIVEEEPECDYEDWDDVCSEIFDCCLQGLDDKEIVNDVQYLFPHYDSDMILLMIEDVRNSYSFRNFS